MILIEISPNHYDFIMQQAKENLCRRMNNSGHWSGRDQIIQECIDGEMDQEFISMLESDAKIEDKVDWDEARQQRMEYQNSVL